MISSPSRLTRQQSTTSGENAFSSALDSFQRKLGSYDQQQWERTIEERVLKGLSHAVPKKVARVKTELIDLDLIRGSAFTKAKPKQGYVATTYLGILRVVFFPFCMSWWCQQTNRVVTLMLFLLYAAQLASMYLYFYPVSAIHSIRHYDLWQVLCFFMPPFHPFLGIQPWTGQGRTSDNVKSDIGEKTTHDSSDVQSVLKELDEIPASEVLTPVIMFLILSIIQSHIAASHSLDERTRTRIDQDCSPRSSSSSQNQTSRPPSSTTRTSSFAINRKKRSPDHKSPNNSGKRPSISNQTQTSSKGMGNEGPNRPVEQPQEGIIKKPSDEESGLDLPLEDPSTQVNSISSTFNDRKRRSLSSSTVTRVTVPETSDAPSSSILSANSCSRMNRSKNRLVMRKRKLLSSVKKSEEAGQLTGEDADRDEEEDDNQALKADDDITDVTAAATGACDLSSMDEISPYSTVNSTTDSNWRRYSQVISQRIRSLSLSQSKKTNRRFSGADEVLRSRSGTFSKIHSHARVRYSPAANNRNVERPGNEHILGVSLDNNSSNDSEASVSPTTPNKPQTDLDWNLLNSEGTSEDDEEDQTGDHMSSVRRRSPMTLHQTSPVHHHINFKENDLLSDSFPDQDLYPLAGGGLSTSASLGNRSELCSCSIWQNTECQKVDLSVLDISSAVIRKASKARHSNEYLYLGFLVALALSLIPGLFRLQSCNSNSTTVGDGKPVVFGPQNQVPPSSQINILKTSEDEDVVSWSEMLPSLLHQLPVPEPSVILESVAGGSNSSFYIKFILFVSIIERYCMSVSFFFLLCVAERTYRDRLLFAKYFCHLTSARRARRSELPHFRLNKVRNIKTWLSVRSYLKKHGPQRSVDIIVSCAFILSVSILTFLCIQLLRENGFSGNLYCWEMLSCNLAIGVYIMRLMVLGIKMNRKYKSNLSVLITEQINLYLQLEQKPHKKEELTLANHVLKLAADLLKQLEAPFKISGFSANHYLYNITKVVVLSAFSAVLTEMLGFKLKLHKIKL